MLICSIFSGSCKLDFVELKALHNAAVVFIGTAAKLPAFVFNLGPYTLHEQNLNEGAALSYQSNISSLSPPLPLSVPTLLAFGFSRYKTTGGLR